MHTHRLPRLLIVYKTGSLANRKCSPAAAQLNVRIMSTISPLQWNRSAYSALDRTTVHNSLLSVETSSVKHFSSTSSQTPIPKQTTPVSPVPPPLVDVSGLNKKTNANKENNGIAVAGTDIETDKKRLASSKVEKTLEALKNRKEEDVKPEKSPAISAAPLTDAEAKDALAKQPRPLWKRIWDELVHYYHGFRLLFVDIRVSSKLMYRVLNGEELSRREHKQLVRTVGDMFRLVPFSVFIIVPFMEFLLPVALKLFPGMLPSTFQSSSDENKKIKAQLKVRLEMAKFLQSTLDEMAVRKKGEETHSKAAKEFAMFCEKIRKAGEFASSEEVLKFSKLFEDEITLDSLTRPQLVAICRMLDLPTYGPSNMLRFQLRMKLRNLRSDDMMIEREGIDSLTIAELQAACRARGMRSLGVPEEKLKYQLQQWLLMSLTEGVPPSLLLLSRALLLPDNIGAADMIKEAITQLPKQALTEAKYKIGELEGKVDNRTKLELIKQEEEAIKKEREEEKFRKMVEKEEKKLDEEELLKEKILEAAAKEEPETPDMAPLLKDKAAPLEKPSVDVATLNVASIIVAALSSHIKRRGTDQISKEDLTELEDALETIAEEKRKLLIEKEELDELKEEMKDYEVDVRELNVVTLQDGKKADIAETKAASRLYKRVNRMISNLDGVIDKLNAERIAKSETIEQLDKKGESVDKQRDDLIAINDLLLSIRRIQKSTDDSRLQRIVDILDTIDVDHDGVVELDHVLKVIDMLGRENVKLSGDQMKEIIQLILKEEAVKQTLRKQEHEEVAKPEVTKETEAAPDAAPPSAEKSNLRPPEKS